MSIETDVRCRLAGKVFGTLRPVSLGLQLKWQESTCVGVGERKRRPNVEALQLHQDKSRSCAGTQNAAGGGNRKETT